MERSKEIAMDFYKQLGCLVEDIEETDDKRADIRSFDSKNCEYVTEVKERLDDPKTIASQLKTYSDDEMDFVYRVSPMNHSNRLDGIFKSGGEQLAKTPAASDAYHLLWLHCESADGKLNEIRARNTFYGIVPIIPDGGNSGCMCFYFHFNTAYMLPHVNGLFVFRDRSVQLYLNEFADSAEEFRKSELVKRLEGAVFDPREVVANEVHIAFHGNTSRKNESDVLDGLEEQTGIRYHVCLMNQHIFGS